MMILLTLTLTLAFYILYLFIPQWDSWLFRVRKTLKQGEKICCLTFDDGPSKEWTPQILDILKGNDIRANFFITGERANQSPDIVKRIASEGHEIGNHTMTHRKLTFCSKEVLQKEIAECNEVLKSITGKSPLLFRAPHGFKPPLMRIRNVIARTQSERSKIPPSPPLKKGGVGAFGISTAPSDFFKGLTLIPWTKGLWDTDMPPADVLIKRVTKNFKPLEILLLHDGIDNRPIPQHRESTVEALPKIIDEYKKRGYRFATVSELNRMIKR